VADQSVEIPNRAAFKASEVCEIAQIPSYVLRSWEKEFPGLGAAARPGGPRIYRRSDVEQILHIKQLVFAEGLTLAGARRKIEGDPPAEELQPDLFASPVNADVRTRVAQAKQELRSLLNLLSAPRPSAAVEQEPAARAVPTTWPPTPRGIEETPPPGESALESVPKARRARRTSKEERESKPTEVE
jgi:DNA-binding transcriptional MerR regulator